MNSWTNLSDLLLVLTMGSILVLDARQLCHSGSLGCGGEHCKEVPCSLSAGWVSDFKPGPLIAPKSGRRRLPQKKCTEI